jgi:putative ABC transport system permease protein
VLGASLGHILWIFNKESVIMVLMAFILVAPLSWIAMERWLANFAVKVELNILWFIIPAILTIIMSSITISLQAWLTSRRTP